MLRARLLGALDVELDGAAINSPVRHRPWALFSYLALAERPVLRAELASTFWPDVLDQSARASLRSALWTLRRAIGDRLVVDGERVGLDAEWVDLREFERLAAEDAGAALELCRGELLEGIADDWATRARDRHRERVIELLERLAGAAEQRGDQGEAVALTRQQIEHDPFDEAAHRRLIARLAGSGDRSAAVLTYRALAERLRRELGVAPSAATRELAERVRADARAQAPRRLAARPAPTPLVGRERELAELQRAWNAATHGSGGVAVVDGEAGIGKTRLTHELRLRAEASGARTATCAALDLGGTAPFSLWAELIRELLPTLPAPDADAIWPDDLAVLVAELPSHFGRAGAAINAIAPDLQRTRLFEAVVALLGWAARERPLLLVVEDAHDADAPSLELAGYAARRLGAMTAMIAITRRRLPDGAGVDRLEHALRSRGLLVCELSLEPLGVDAIAALARETAPLADEGVSLVVERADGNPLLAVETARALHGGNRTVAESLRGSVRATLGPLSGDVRRLVEVAAVAARPLELIEIDTLALNEAATAALQTGLIDSDGGKVAFRHALLREAAYQEVAEPRRRTLHRAWAQALLDAEDAGAVARPDEVARHLRLAGADRAAVPQLARAAAGARAVAALEQAAAYLQEALAIAPDGVDMWLELGELEAWRGRRDAAEEAFRRGLVLLERADPLMHARGWLRRGRAYHGPICVPRAVLDSARRALELLGESGRASEQERSEALAACAWAEAVAGSVDEAERLLAEMSATGDGGDDLRTYDIGHARALALMRRGRFADAYGPSIAAGDAIARAGRPDLAYGCWANAASAADAAGDPQRALEFLDRGMAAIDGQGLQSLAIQLLGARSFVLRRAGRLDQALEAAESERLLAEALDQPELEAMASHDGGLVLLEQGASRAASELLEAALVEGAPISRPLTRIALAETLARCGEPDRAAEQVRATVLEPVRPSDFPESLVPRLARVQGLIALARDQRGEAERRLEESVDGWERVLGRTARADIITSVLTDLGRPIVGLVDPERELARARSDLEAIRKGAHDALVP